MNIKELMEMFQGSLYKLNNKQMFMKMLDFGSSLIVLDTLNRFLVLLQNSEATDIRSENCWSICNKKLKARVKPLYILCPRFKQGYTDKSSQEAIDKASISQEELNTAFELGIVEKTEDIAEMNIVALFDVSDTEENTEYSLSKPIVTVPEVFRAIREVTGCSLHRVDNEKAEGWTEDYEILKIYGKKAEELLPSISRVLAKYIIDNNGIRDDMDEWEADLIESGIEYAFATLLKIDKEHIKFNMLESIDGEQAFRIIETINNLMTPFIGHLKYSENGFRPMEIREIDKLNRAGSMLGNLRAFEIRRALGLN